jgi:pyridoxine/pyridoxamine 5'-phosphate oxidase
MSSLLIPPPDDPVRAAAQWLGEAEALGRRNANAIALASADAAGRVSVRMVLLKELAPLGYVVFYTNYGSRKGEELLTTRRAAAVLYWHELGRQVRFEGPVVRSPDAESDAYFASRPTLSQVNAWSSEQSRPLADPPARAPRPRRQGGRRQTGRPNSAAPRLLGRLQVVARGRGALGRRTESFSRARALRARADRARRSQLQCGPLDFTALATLALPRAVA